MNTMYTCEMCNEQILSVVGTSYMPEGVAPQTTCSMKCASQLIATLRGNTDWAMPSKYAKYHKLFCAFGFHDWTAWEIVAQGKVKLSGNVVIDQQRICIRESCQQIELERSVS